MDPNIQGLAQVCPGPLLAVLYAMGTIWTNPEWQSERFCLNPIHPVVGAFGPPRVAYIVTTKEEEGGKSINNETPPRRLLSPSGGSQRRTYARPNLYGSSIGDGISAGIVLPLHLHKLTDYCLPKMSL
ncbi:hypothetical protein Ancab_023116 [Ancistrocladus abbreviatus]